MRWARADAISAGYRVYVPTTVANAVYRNLDEFTGQQAKIYYNSEDTRQSQKIR